MNLLLDTHSFLWFVLNNPRLSTSAAEAIEAETSASYLSIASIWEMAIKVSIGKLSFPTPLNIFVPDQLEQNGIQLLPVSVSHALRVASLPFLHKDPFDRLLIAQSLVEPMAIVSTDVIFDGYGVTRIW